MGDWREMRWLRLHVMVAPFGIVAVTAMLLARSGKWSGWESLESAATLVDLGAVVYGMVAVLVERGVRMVFWALDQRRQWREKWRKEAESVGLAKGRAEERARILRAAKEKGIDIATLFPGEEDSE